MKKAFTLAEVLAALAIVGVIASVSIPTLQAGYQDRKYKSLAKKVHSTLQQAIEATMLEDDIRKARAGMGAIYWLATLEYRINYPDGTGGTVTRTFRKDEPSLRTVVAEIDESSKLASVRLTDGMIIQDSSNLNVDDCDSCSTDTGCAIYVDVDGPSGPTKSDVKSNLYNARNEESAADILVFQCRNNMIMPPPLASVTAAANRTRVLLGIDED